MEININKKALADLYSRVGDRIMEVDTELRSRLTSSDVQTIKPEARQAFAAIGVELPESDLVAYSQAIADNVGFNFTLK